MTASVLPGPRRPGVFAKTKGWIGPLPLQQLLLLAGVVGIFWFMGSNTLVSMERLGLKPGFAFLGQQANFEIGESLIAYSAGDTYGRALLAGLLNTINIAVFGCLLATVLGVSLGVARLSGNLLLAGLVHGYVEVLRNTPLLLQLFLWSAIGHALPPPRNAISLFEAFFLSNRGVYVPKLALDGPPAWIWLPAVLAIVFLAARGFRSAFSGRCHYVPKLAGGIVGLLAILCLALALAGVSFAVELPAKGGFNIRGGISLTPEFAALLVGLVVNASAGISEIVRSGIQSVASGQWEAARSLGLKRGQIMRLVVLPQALRVITPLMTSSYLDLTKNSSLAVAIGFPDIVSVANTTANTTGQSLEAIAILIAVYLTLNLTVSAMMNVYNRRVALKGAQQR